MKNKWLLLTLIIVLFVVGFAGGVIYWSLKKTSDISSSAIDRTKNAQSVLTPTPSAATSAQVGDLKLPSADTEGADIIDAPRYSGSFISEYGKNDDSSMINITYIGQGQSVDILNYYENILPKSDWILRAKDDKSQNYSKEGANLAIEIIQEDLETNLVQYKIHFFKTEI